MNFYKHYIGDFQRDTSHLSLTERGAYLALIHHYYATEKPLPDNHAALCRIAGAMSKQERDAVKAAMRFFTKMESGLVHARIEAEIEKAGKRSDTNREIALEREARRKAQRTEHDESTNRATKRGTTEAPYQTPDTSSSADAEERSARKRFAKPTLDELITEFRTRVADPGTEAAKFLNYYESNGWRVGRNPMKSWRHAVSNWASNCNGRLAPASPNIVEKLTDRSWAGADA